MRIYQNEFDQDIVDDVYNSNPRLLDAFNASFDSERNHINELLAMQKASYFLSTEKEDVRELINRFDMDSLMEISRIRLKNLLVRRATKDAIMYNNIGIHQSMLNALSKRYIHHRVLENDEVIGFAFGNYALEHFTDEEKEIFKEFLKELHIKNRK